MAKIAFPVDAAHRTIAKEELKHAASLWTSFTWCPLMVRGSRVLQGHIIHKEESRVTAGPFRTPHSCHCVQY